MPYVAATAPGVDQLLYQLLSLLTHPITLHQLLSILTLLLLLMEALLTGHLPAPTVGTFGSFGTAGAVEVE
jgi:hypothetical protein